MAHEPPKWKRARVKRVGPRERIVHLKTVPTLRGLPTSALIGLAQRVQERHLATGDRLIEPDAPVRAGFVLVEGRVSLRWGDRNVMTIEAPNSVGFLGTMARVASGVEAKAETPLLVLEISADDLIATYESSFELTMATMRALANEILELRGGYPADPRNPPQATIGPDASNGPDFVERLLSWHRASLFAEANLDAIAELVRQERVVRYAPNEVVWRAGAPSDFSLEIVQGIVRCEPPGGRPPMRMGHGYTLGLDVMSEGPRRFTLVTQTAVVAQRLEHEAWMNVLEDQPELALAYLTSLSRMAMNARAQTLERPLELGFLESSARDPRRA